MSRARSDASPNRRSVLELDLHLDGIEPRIWRRLRVPASLTLLDLHHAIQTVMGWLDYHLHVFEIGDREYGPRPEEEGEREQWAGDDGGVTVLKALTDGDGVIDYLYDFGDDWRIRIRRVGHASSEAGSTVMCLDGERAGPPEDCGGPRAYQEIVDTLAVHGRRGLPSELRAWLPPGFDPAAFDAAAANVRLRNAFREKASPERPAGPHASDEQQLLATLTLATLVLGSRLGKRGQREATKTMRAEILEALQEAELIYTDPKRQTVVITEAGEARAQAFLDTLGLRQHKRGLA
jgi:Plasmid pRiA4b ORF-3-like protein